MTKNTGLSHPHALTFYGSLLRENSKMQHLASTAGLSWAVDRWGKL
jgi:hypothetical protein